MVRLLPVCELPATSPPLDLGYNEARYPMFEKGDSAERQACGAGPTVCVQSKASCSCRIHKHHS
jgi:hypothetical protein